MAQLISYKTRDENRYSTFAVDKSTDSPNSTNCDSVFQNDFANFNQFKLCEPHTKSVKRHNYSNKKINGSFGYNSCCYCCFKKKQIDKPPYSYDIDLKVAQLQLGRYNTAGTLKTEMGPPGKKPNYKEWLWNDSLRSDSDRFLETLEYDDLFITRSLKRMKKIVKVRPIAYRQMGEEAASAEATNKSPLTGSRQISAPASAVASPIASPATSDPYPSQSDEDIDRLVALHQNRQNSLGSLGIRSESMASVYSGAEGRYGTVSVRGQIEFGMQYNYKHAALEVLVKQCRDLAAVDTKRNRSDPYVKLYLLPDKSKTGKRKTKVKKHTLNPLFEETLRFYMLLNSLESRTLWLTVWHSDMFGRNDFLGEVLMPLQGKVFDNPQPQWYNLQERTEPFDDIPVYKGDIIVGLKFIPPDSGSSTPHLTPKSGGSLNLRKFSVKSSSSSSSSSRNSKGALHVLVKEAKHLSAVKVNGTCDAFCKSYLLPDKNRSSKQKTSVVKRSINPVWNHMFIYENISLQDLSERALELTIWDHDRLASNEFLGGVRFSIGSGKVNGKPVDWMDATGKELSLWQSMLNRPNFWVEGCLTLRSSLDNARVAT